MNIRLILFVLRKMIINILTHKISANFILLTNCSGVGAFLFALLKRKKDFLTKWHRDTLLDLRSRSGVTAFASANCCLSSRFSLLYLFLSRNSVFTLKTDKGKPLNILSCLIPLKKKKRTEGSQEEVCKTCAEFRPMIKQSY